MECRYCSGSCHKKGKRNRRQIYQCKNCRKYQLHSYQQKVYPKNEEMVVKLNNEGMGIRSIARVLNVPKTTVNRMLLAVAKKVKAPVFIEQRQEYEVDELRTYVGSKKKECWICFAINRKTKEVVDFIAGRRTKENIGKVVKKVLSLSPTKVYTDRLNVYPGLIPEKLHSTQFRQTNYIERMNLTLRTHLKRLSYKTICYSKSVAMLTACLKIYFWG